MDATDFDRLTKNLSMLSTRRAALAAAMGGILAAAAGTSGEAKTRRRGRRRARAAANTASVDVEQAVLYGQLFQGIDYRDRMVVITSKQIGEQVAECSGNGQFWPQFNAVVVGHGGADRAVLGILLPPGTEAKPGARYRVTDQVSCPGPYDEVTLEPL